MGVIAVLVAAPSSAQAATITVDTTQDQNDGAPPCSLREAVGSVNAGVNTGGCVGSGTYGSADTIVLPAGTLEVAGSGDDTNMTGDFDVTASVLIQGATPAGSTQIDLAQHDRAFDVQAQPSPVNLSLQDLQIQNGSVVGNGGAIRADDPDGALSLDTVAILNSSATDLGGAITRDTTSTGTTTLTDSEFESNHAGDDGGAIFRSAPSANGIQMNIRRSLFAANTSGAKGGAVYQQGNGTSENEANYANDTFSGNSAVEGGGAIGLGNPAPSAQLRFVTLADNSTPAASTPTTGGGAIFADAIQDVIGLQGTILAHNLASGVDSSCAGPGSFSDAGLGYDIETANTCHLTGTSLVNSDPLLAPLAENGGPTGTRGLYDGSPAIDRVPTGAACASATGVDQRGTTRPVGPACDVGAFEGSVGPVPTPPASGGGSPGTAPITPTPPTTPATKKCKKKKHRASAAKKCKKKK
jgi:CSLREA domain-containing protein